MNVTYWMEWKDSGELHIKLVLSDGSTYNAGDVGSIPGLGRSPGGGHGNSLQYSGLGNPMDRGVWRAAVHGITNSQI